MGVKVTNNAFGTLSAAINTTATTITLDSGQGARFPTLGASDYFFGTLVDTSNNLEIVKVTARSTDSLTVVRGQDGTTALSFAIGDRFELRPVAALFEDIIDSASPAGVSDKANTSTGSFDVPSGTTAERPSSPSTGETRFNSTLNRMEYYDGYNWLGMNELSGYITSASGGTITTDGDYKVHKFTSSGTFTITTIIGSPEVEYLIVGGGGGGGYFYAGGGGAGGVLTGSTTDVSATSYTVTIGGGGGGSTAGTGGSANGSSSSVFGKTAVGGAGGQHGWTNDGGTAAYAKNGGSGGGGGNVSSLALRLVTAKFGGLGVTGQGHGGGHSSWWGSSDWGGGGGGGGAARPGDAARQGSGPVGGGGAGGDGIQSDITGSNVYYGGGGGGGGSNRPNAAVSSGSGSDGAGGYGGGGMGGSESLASVAGTANTGGGGGGGGSGAGSFTSGSSGGSGVVVIRYRFQ